MHDLTSQPRPILITCGRGIAPLLAREVDALDLPARTSGPGAVLSRGTLRDCMGLNLWLRCAQRVLLCVGDAQSIPDAAALYRAASELPWEDWLPVEGRFSITVDVHNPTIRDTRFAALKFKDAIADRIMQRLGRRPDSGADRSRAAVIHLHWQGSRAGFYLDTSGEPLARRGYRLQGLEAPLQETLAAALLAAANWKPGVALVNPMCGSGTLAIEAALLAGDTAPGLLRDSFGFQFLRDAPLGAWRTLTAQAGNSASPGEAPGAQAPKQSSVAPGHLPPVPRHPRPAPGRIVASDRRAAAVDAARANGQRAGVGEQIAWQVCDFARTRLPPPPGLILINPEYGERLGNKVELQETYRRLGRFLGGRPKDYAVGLLGGDPALNAMLGLRPDRVTEFYNGPIRCEFLFFQP